MFVGKVAFWLGRTSGPGLIGWIVAARIAFEGRPLGSLLPRLRCWLTSGNRSILRLSLGYHSEI